MKALFKLSVWLLLLLAGLVGYAQTLVQAEYFIDDDPGVGMGTSITLSSNLDSISDAFTVSTIGIEAGWHQLHIRVRDDQGRWGMYASKFFRVLPPTSIEESPDPGYVQAAEYFIDDDPGVGSGTPIPVNTPEESIGISGLQIPSEGLESGWHRLHIRTQDSLGHWGMFASKFFRILDTTDLAETYESGPLVRAEYFIDEDPGPGLGIPISIPEGDSSRVEGLEVATDGLEAGWHRLHVRAQDSVGNWGHFQSKFFRILDPEQNDSVVKSVPIVGAEYFIDQDPGQGKGTPVAIEPGDTVALTSFSVPTEGLEVGWHSLNIRMVDSLGQWGHFQSKFFRVLDSSDFTPVKPAPSIVAAEYFLDDLDPGFGLANEIPISNPDSILTRSFQVDAGALALGKHYLTIRTMDENGVWSFNRRTEFDICLAPPPVPEATEVIGCGGRDTLTLKATGSDSSEYIWYTSYSGPTSFGAGGNVLAMNEDSVTVDLDETTDFFVATVGEECPSSRFKVTATVLDALANPTLQNEIRCGFGEVELEPQAGAPIGGTYRWYFSNESDSIIFEGDVYRTDSLSANTAYYVESITQGGACTSPGRTGVVAIIKTDCLPQEITFELPEDFVFGSGLIDLEAVSSINGLPITYLIDVDEDRFELLGDSAIDFLELGVYTITAIQEGNDSVFAANPVSQTVRIIATSATVIATANTPVCEGLDLDLSATSLINAAYSWTGPVDSHPTFGNQKLKE